MSTMSAILAVGLLGVMFILIFFSAWNDSAIFDETAHIGAGYSYLTQKDMRLNPEHPPLMKDVAALPLLLFHPTFKTDTAAWQGVNEQWVQGGAFLYDFGNNPDKIIHYARFPVMLLAVITGFIFFRWVRSLFGEKIALLALFFYALSPTIIAHARYVTTDIAATFGFLIGIATFLRFLHRPSQKRLIEAGVAFGVAELLKFSLILLVPMDLVLALVWLLSDENFFDDTDPADRRRFFLKNFVGLYLRIAGIFFVGAVIIWVVYLWHVWGYQPEKQVSDTMILTTGFRPPILAQLDVEFARHALTRPFAQYLLGVMMVARRSVGGNNAYFLGEVSSKGWLSYFPTVYILKETLAFHILTLLALWLAIRRVRLASQRSWAALRGWLHDNFAVFASLFVVGFYWTYSSINPLNIGVRHVLPTFPFIYFLVARELVLWVSDFEIEWGHWLHVLYQTFLAPLPKIIFISFMLLWIALDIFASFPFYLSYFNELVGLRNGYQYVTDSNYDWGQDLKRLKEFAEKNQNEKIYLDYFGGGRPEYYLDGQFVPWWSAKGPPPPGALFAVSANSLEGARARYVGGLSIKAEDTYPWLANLEPARRAGTSIFIYKIP